MRLVRLSYLAACVSLACAAPMAQRDKIPPAPVISLWPDETYLPDRQCHGTLPVEDLQHYLPRAKVAMWLPSTRSVSLSTERRCLVVRVDSYGAGRLAELIFRSVAVPRNAVLLLVG
jgi:hypothetical protein